MTSVATWEHSALDAVVRLSRWGMQSMAAGVEALNTATTQWASQWAAPEMPNALLDPQSVSRLSTAPARWFGHVAAREAPSWSCPHEIGCTTPIAWLRDFSQGADDSVVPTLVLPPQAGHSSAIVDFSSGQSQIATIRAAGLTRAFSLDWVAATRETRHTGIEDYVVVIRRAVEHIGGPVNLIGDCQGGWLAAIYAALHPEDIHTLTLAGAPIDFHAGDGTIPAHVQLLTSAFGMAPYRMMVAAGGGNMPGDAVLSGFIGIRPEAELAKQLQLYNHLDDPQHLARYRDFENWFKHTQDIPGTFYLWLVEELFWRNKLIHGQLHVAGRRVDLASISCPLYLLAGASDHITPPEQVFAAAGAVSTPAADITRRTSPGGHLGLFMGREALREHWSVLLADIHDRSHTHTDPPRDERVARQQTPPDPGQPPVPAP